MPYTLNNGSQQQPYRGGRNILASEHLQFVEGGATLDASVFGATYIPVGTLIARNTTSGLYEPVAEGATDLTGYDNASILNVDVNCNGVDDVVVGEVIVRGSVYEAKLPTAVPDFFRAANPMIRYVNEIV